MKDGNLIVALEDRIVALTPNVTALYEILHSTDENEDVNGLLEESNAPN